MEYPLTQLVRLTQSNKTNVLILVLMEYPLTNECEYYVGIEHVLILVLMEYPLTMFKTFWKRWYDLS